MQRSVIYVLINKIFLAQFPFKIFIQNIIVNNIFIEFIETAEKDLENLLETS
jgi:hypothetical protein